jgi:hypothetical protein
MRVISTRSRDIEPPAVFSHHNFYSEVLNIFPAQVQVLGEESGRVFLYVCDRRVVILTNYSSTFVFKDPGLRRVS